ncbi:SPFH domain-containing protein [Alicyclobacillus sendaiensis]|uniref:SPFH domain-containing protein n=1 Tax=Alicyclobacillus sendaiensis TaxID=192387 RepID=UPI0009F894F6|nr:SPFH domain-containing protein [Alicyclobacillus sendaiensis]
MPQIRQVISTLSNDGKEIMGPDVLAYHYPDNSILNGSLLTVESNHFAVLKSRGAILNVYETGQYVIQTPDRPIIGAFQQAFFGGQSPWQYEVIYINRAKLILEVSGVAYSKEMAEMGYHVSCYVHVDTKEDALKLVQHMPLVELARMDGEIAQKTQALSPETIGEVEQLLRTRNERWHALVQP